MPKSNTKPTIAIDIDNVLACHNEGIAEWHNKTFGTAHTAQTYFTDHWREVWQISREETEKRAKAFHTSDTHKRLAPMQGAKDALAKLQSIYQLKIITVRRQSIIEDTHIWLAEHFPGTFSKTDVHFIHAWDQKDTTTKAEVCKRINAKFIIDDSLKHCAQAADSGVKAVLFGNSSWNQAPLLPKNVWRAADWDEALALLKLKA